MDQISNVDYFVVQRSTNHIHTTDLTKVSAVAARLEYAYLDISPKMGDNYYRLKIIAKDGTESYSDWKHVGFGQAGIHPLVYPNPIQDRIHVKFFNQLETRYHWIITNAVGQQILAGEQHVDAGGQSITIAATDLPSGVYFLQLKNKKNNITRQYQIVKY